MSILRDYPDAFTPATLSLSLGTLASIRSAPLRARPEFVEG